MRTTLFMSCIALVFSGLSAQANRDVFIKISEVAAVANGSAEVHEFDMALGKSDIEAQGLLEFEDEYWEGCGPWRTFRSSQYAIKAVDSIESAIGETNIVTQLNQLEENGDLLTAVGAISNANIECSVTWIRFYGTDGSLLELRYNLGD